MALINEVYFIFDIHLPKPEGFCKVSEDNKSCISVTDSKNYHQKKHTAINYHHLQSFVQNKII